MLDVEYSNISFYEQSKKNIFAIQRELMRSKVQLPLLFVLIIAMIEFYLSSSIFFVNDLFEPDIINKILRYPLLQDLQLSFGVGRNFLIILLVIYQTITLILYTIIWFRSSQHHHLKLINKIATILFAFYRMNIPMILYFVTETNKRVFYPPNQTTLVSQWKYNGSTDMQMKNDKSIIIPLIILNFINFNLIILSLHISFLNIYPLRKGNKYWNFNNRYEFINYILSISRALVISLDGFSVVFVIISFVFQIMLYRYSFQNKGFTQEVRIQRSFKNNLGCFLHLSVLFSLVTSNKLLSLQMFIFLFGVVLIKTIIEYLNYNRKHLYYPLCDSDIYEFYNFYFILEQKSDKGYCQSTISSYSRNNENGMKQVFDIHQANCKMKTCIFKTCKREKLNDLQYCQKLTDKIMEDKRYQSPENYIMAELWKLQIQVKNNIDIYTYVKQKTYENQFIFQAVTELLKDIQAKTQTNFINQILKTKKFYQTLDETMSSFSKFYAQIGKSTPQFQMIVEQGYECRKKSNKLKTLYNDILKTKSMSFKMLELYLQFQVRFGSCHQLSQDLLQKAAQFQKNQTDNLLQDLYLPTMYVNEQTGIIQNFNMEMSRFLKFTKFELKLKPLNDLFMPSVDIQQFNEYINKISRVQRIKTIIKKGSKQYICVKLRAIDKTIDNRKIWVINFEQQKLFQNKNIYLINNEFDLILSIRKQTYFKTPLKSKAFHGLNIPIPIDWEIVYQNYIKTQKQQLIKNRILKLRIPQLQNLLVIINLENTINKQHYLITVTIVVDVLENRQNRLSTRNSSISKSMSKQKLCIFKFYYVQHQNQLNSNDKLQIQQQQQYQQNQTLSNQSQNNTPPQDQQNNPFIFNLFNQGQQMHKQNQINYHLTIVGQKIDLKKPQISKYYSSTRNLQSQMLFKNLNQLIVKKTLMNQEKLKNGIKTYRLWQHELYNIDLQDKQSYMNQLDIDPSQMSNSESAQVKPTQFITFYMIALIFFLVIILSVIVYMLISQSIQNFDTIQQSFNKQFLMQSILLSYNKMNAVMRDIKGGLYVKFQEDWQSDLVVSLINIKKKRMDCLNLFREDDYQIEYDNVTVAGNFNYLFDVYLSEVSTLVREGENITKIDNILELAFQFIDEHFQTQRLYHFGILFSQAQNIAKNLINMFYVCLISIFLIQIVIVKLLHTVFTKLKERLHFILLTSDYQAKVKYQNSQKLRYAIEMIQKNFDIDLKNILIDKNHFHKRKKPKNVKFNNNKKYGRIIFLILYFFAHITYVSICKSNASKNVDKVQQMFGLGRSLMRSYTQIVHISTSAVILGHFSETEMTSAKQSLFNLELSRGSSSFGPTADKLIELFMYQDVCKDQQLSIKLFANQKATCLKALPGFQIQNPYSFGCINYIRRLYYALIDNITETLGATGIYSTPIARAYNILAQTMLSEGLQRIQEYTDELSSQNKILVFLSFLYIAFAAYLIWNEKKNTTQIKQIIEFFKSGQQKRLFNNQKNCFKEKNNIKPLQPRQNRTSINSLNTFDEQKIQLLAGKIKQFQIPIKERNQYAIGQDDNNQSPMLQVQNQEAKPMIKRRMSRFAGTYSFNKHGKQT